MACPMGEASPKKVRRTEMYFQYVLKSVNFNGPFLLEMWADRKENYLEVIKSAREFIIEKLYNSKYFLKGKKNNKEVNFKEKLEIENANAI